MKKYLAIVILATLSWIGFEYLYFYQGDLYIPAKEQVACTAWVDGEEIFLQLPGKEQVVDFDIKGVNISTSKPGYFSVEMAVTKDEYKKWFAQIQELGANTIKLYNLDAPSFYEAFYEYNINNPNPLYLIHGVLVDEYYMNASYSALAEEFTEAFMEDCREMVDVLHGRHKIHRSERILSETYNKDVSQWVCGYVLGSEWDGTLVAYTDESMEQVGEFNGKYLYTQGASNFEVFLAGVGDAIIDYEMDKYGTQKMISFFNAPATDPLAHDEFIVSYFEKSAEIDVEHIKCKDSFKAGQFASYQAYPYYPDYYSMLLEQEENTYKAYLSDINNHHNMPVVITEFGVPSSRGRANVEKGQGRNQGFLNEKEQGEALVSMHKDIMESGCEGAIVFTWQDEWFKKTWNTTSNTNSKATPYWHDAQTADQHYGLLAFDPGEEKSICYVDGNKKDWTEKDIVLKSDKVTLSQKYDEKFIYFMVEKEGFDLEEDRLYIPIDTTPKSGADHADNLNLKMSRPADFIIDIYGKDNSRVWVQEYYNTLNALFFDDISPENFFSKEFPKKDSGTFTEIYLLNKSKEYYEELDGIADMEVARIEFGDFDQKNPNHYDVQSHYETGKLTYGNANPKAKDFNSLADFCAGEGFVEIKIPWQLLNFADPSNMYIHDDYYEHYGVEYMQIESMYVGAGDGSSEIQLKGFELYPLGKEPKYHERLKKSYYILKDYWTKQ